MVASCATVRDPPTMSDPSICTSPARMAESLMVMDSAVMLFTTESVSEKLAGPCTSSASPTMALLEIWSTASSPSKLMSPSSLSSTSVFTSLKRSRSVICEKTSSEMVSLMPISSIAEEMRI